jgi:hypothetical protein
VNQRQVKGEGRASRWCRARLRVTVLSAVVVLAALALPTVAHSQETLEPLGSFETFDSLGFSPDGVTYQPKMAHLLIASAGAEVPNETGVFETTLSGELIRHVSLGGLGFSITIATNGPSVGHRFMVAYEGPGDGSASVTEYDEAWNVVGGFEVAGVAPGDGIAWNHRSRTLVVVDLDASPQVLIEVTPEGEVVRTLTTPCMAGVTYNIPTNSYFGVCPNATMWEMATDGTVLRSFNLNDYGISQPVGIGSGQGKLFVADEIDVPNSGGIIHIFRSPRRAG